MMHDDEKRVNALERTLKETYRSRSDAGADVDVTHSVMHEIRRSSAERNRWMPAAMLDHLVWRTATITAAVVLTATMLTVGLWRAPADSSFLVVEEFESVPLFGD